MSDKRLYKEIYGIKRLGEDRSFWTRIGAAFENRDGSLNLVFDYLPADLKGMTIQVRDPKAQKVDQKTQQASLEMLDELNDEQQGRADLAGYLFSQE